MIPFGAQLAIAAAPTLIGLAAGPLMKSKASPYEREMKRLSSYFKTQSDLPYQQTEEGAAQIGMLNDADMETRRRNANIGTTSGATSEAQVAAMGQANNSYVRGFRGVMSGANDHRRRSLASYMNALGAAEQARELRLQQDAQRLGNLTGGLGQIGGAVLMSDMYRGQVPGKAGVQPGAPSFQAPAGAGFNAKTLGTRRLSSVFGNGGSFDFQSPDYAPNGALSNFLQ